MKKISKTLIKKSTSWKPSLYEGHLIESNSWFSLRKKQVFKLDNPIQQIETSNIRCKKIQIEPTLKQRNILLTWFELSRLTYNLTINLLKMNNLSKTKMRDKVKQEMKNNSYLHGLQKNCSIYQHTLDFSVFDVFKARKSAFTNLKSKTIKFFRMRYKKQNYHIKTLVLESINFNKEGTGLKKLGLENLNPSEKIVSTHDTRMGYNSRTNKFTLYVPYDKELKKDVKRSDICALDPGIRTFQTLYSPSGITYQFGDEKGIIKKNIERIEKVRGLKNKSWYKKYVNRLSVKLKNRIADLHWKTSSFLCKNFNTILVGNMSTKGIVKNTLNLHSSTKRMTYALSHFLFKERLKSKVQEYNCIFREVDESYTSKTCDEDIEINEFLGSSKLFQCPHHMCLYKMDRDIHGARNIYIKNL